MINNVRAFNDELYDFLKIDIQFNTIYNQYLFKGNWSSTINNLYFDNRIEKLKKLLFIQLENGLENKLFLFETLDEIKKSLNFFQKRDYDDFSFLEESLIIIRKKANTNPIPPKELFDYNYFLDKLNLDNHFNEDFINLDDEIHAYYYHLEDLFKNKISTNLEFEESKLMYCIIKFVEYIYELQNFVESIYENVKSIEFSVINNEKTALQINPKCQVNLSKLNTAQLFKFLFSEGFISIKNEDTKDESKIKKFIEESFTYQNQRSKKHENINNINKEFSELIWDHKEIQIQFIDELILKLEARKEVILKFRNSNSSEFALKK